MRNFTSKAQAAMEFLTTYGWAFIIILITIAALWYFGVLNPSSNLPDRCNMGYNLECLAYALRESDSGAGALKLKLKNNFAEPIIVTSWDTSSEGGIPFSCTQKPATGIWLDEEIRDAEFTGCNAKDAGLSIGDKGKIDVKMNYYLVKSTSTYTKLVEGEVIATVTSSPTQTECNDWADNDNNGCIDYTGGDTGCASSSDTTETGGTCPGAGGQSDPLNCYVSSATACSGDIIFHMSDITDSHAEVPAGSNFDKNVCCRSATTIISDSCGGGAILLRLSAAADAHAEKNTQSNYNINVCMSAAVGTVSCRYEDNPLLNCVSPETCVASISADTDAHVGDCVTQPFNEKICCSLT